MTPTSHSKKPFIITIDGPAGAGKSTVARLLAKRLGCLYLDTGAMYRALTWKALRDRIDLNNETALRRLAETTLINLNPSDDGVQVLVDGQDVTEAIRTPEVTNATHHIAGCPSVREVLVERQRTIAAQRDVVAEGRDTGTVVFPHASHKFFLEASVDERVRRRLKEWRQKGIEADERRVREDVIRRDERDRNRSVGPLVPAADACIIDTTHMSVDDVVETLLDAVNPLQENPCRAEPT